MSTMSDMSECVFQVYKQKVKHLLYEQQNMLSELKAESVISTKQLQREHAVLENHLQKDLRNLKVYLREQELSSENVRKNNCLVCA